jgi:hypothetical protein
MFLRTQPEGTMQHHILASGLFWALFAGSLCIVAAIMPASGAAPLDDRAAAFSSGGTP